MFMESIAMNRKQILWIKITSNSCMLCLSACYLLRTVFSISFLIIKPFHHFQSYRTSFWKRIFKAEVVSNNTNIFCNLLKKNLWKNKIKSHSVLMSLAMLIFILLCLIATSVHVLQSWDCPCWIPLSFLAEERWLIWNLWFLCCNPSKEALQSNCPSNQLTNGLFPI